MAVNPTDKALRLCNRLATAAGQVMTGVREMIACKEEKENAGIDFNAAALQTKLQESTLKHASGDNFNSVVTTGIALKAWLEAGNHDDVLDQAHP